MPWTSTAVSQVPTTGESAASAGAAINDAAAASAAKRTDLNMLYPSQRAAALPEPRPSPSVSHSPPPNNAHLVAECLRGRFDWQANRVNRSGEGDIHARIAPRHRSRRPARILGGGHRAFAHAHEARFPAGRARE